MDVDELIKLLEPFKGQNRRVLININEAVTEVDTDKDGDIILKGPRR